MVSGSPRSGTTWLAEMLSRGLGAPVLAEAVHPHAPAAREVGMSWRPWRPPGESWPPARRFFTLLLTRATAGRQCGLVKEIRTNRLLPWLVTGYPELTCIAIIRHPCGVVSSQRLHPAFPTPRRAPQHDLEYVDRRLPHLSAFARSLRAELQIRALTWCLDQHVVLAADGLPRLLIANYERLLERERTSVSALAAELGVRLRASPEPRISSIASGFWSADHETKAPEARIRSWCDRLTGGEVEGVLEVTERVGILGFTRSPLVSRPPGLAGRPSLRRPCSHGRRHTD